MIKPILPLALQKMRGLDKKINSFFMALNPLLRKNKVCFHEPCLLMQLLLVLKQMYPPLMMPIPHGMDTPGMETPGMDTLTVWIP